MRLSRGWLAASVVASLTVAEVRSDSSYPVALYGNVDVSVGKETKTDSVEVMSGFSKPTVIGASARKELEPGVSGVFRVETANINASGGVDGMVFGRAAYVGLDTDAYGKFLAGRIASIANQTMLGYDLNSVADSSPYLRVGISPLLTNNLGDRRSRQVQYFWTKTPGLVPGAGFTPRDGSGATNSKPLASVGARLLRDTWSVAATCESASGHPNPLIDDGDRTACSAGAGYQAGVVTFVGTIASAGWNPSFDAVNRGVGFGVAMPFKTVRAGLQVAKNTGNGIGAAEFFVKKEVFKNVIVHGEYGATTRSKTMPWGYVASDSYFSVGVAYSF